MNKNYYIPFIIVIIITAFILLYFFSGNKKENWANYEREPLQFLDTGSTPLNFYQRNIYRLPYRYPFTFEKSYPLPNQSYYELL